MLRRTAATLAAVIASCAVTIGPATAHADTSISTAIPSGPGCTDRTLYTPFTFDDDTNPYYLVVGGDFEGYTSSWFGSGAYRTAENEPWQVGGPEDTTSVVLSRAGATLSAPAMCVRDSEPTMRFFYKAPGTPGAKLYVKMRTTSTTSTTSRTIVIDGSTPGWQVSPPLNIENDTDSTGTQRLLLDFQSGGGSWNIDDVYVDPWKWVVR